MVKKDMRELQVKFINTYNTLNLLLNPESSYSSLQDHNIMFLNESQSSFICNNIMVGTYITIFKYLRI